MIAIQPSHPLSSPFPPAHFLLLELFLYNIYGIVIFVPNNDFVLKTHLNIISQDRMQPSVYHFPTDLLDVHILKEQTPNIHFLFYLNRG